MMDVSWVALLLNKAPSFKSSTRDMSLFKLRGSNKEEPVIDGMDAQALSRYITMKAHVLDEQEEGIQRSPSEASLVFYCSKGRERTPFKVHPPPSQRNTLKNSIRRGLMMLPGNIVLMNAAQSVRRHQIGYGVKSSMGHRIHMEDSHTIKTSFFRFPISLECTQQSIPDFVQTELDMLAIEGDSDNSSCPWSDVKVSMNKTKADNEVHCVFDDFDLFLVCDGHGGAQVSQYCTSHFRRILEQRLATSLEERYVKLLQTASAPKKESPSSTALCPFESLPERSVKSASNLGEGRCALVPSGLGRSCSHSPDSESDHVQESTKAGVESISSRSSMSAHSGAQCGLDVHHLRDCLTQSFLQMDSEVKEQAIGDFEGTTALAALVGSWHVCIANCGDSRAVLSRGGQSIRLTRDHKPYLEDERSRIEANGGFVLDAFGCSRVNGFLAMSRAIGDHLLPSVIPDPDVTILHRHQDDEFIVLATDGLWDVMSDKEVCDMARKCLARAEAKGARHMASRVAANVLLKAALDKRSTDNITIVVVDVRMAKTDLTR